MRRRNSAIFHFLVDCRMVHAVPGSPSTFIVSRAALVNGVVPKTSAPPPLNIGRRDAVRVPLVILVPRAEVLDKQGAAEVFVVKAARVLAGGTVPAGVQPRRFWMPIRRSEAGEEGHAHTVYASKLSLRVRRGLTRVTEATRVLCGQRVDAPLGALPDSVVPRQLCHTQ